MWTKFKRWIFSVHMEVQVNHVQWPARVKLYAVFFGKYRYDGNFTPNRFPETIPPAEKGFFNAAAIQELLRSFKIDQVNVVVKDPGFNEFMKKTRGQYQ